MNKMKHLGKMGHLEPKRETWLNYKEIVNS